MDQQKLYSKYPVIFSEKDLPETESCMYWGLPAGDGWYDLVDTLCEFIDEKNKTLEVPIVAKQVKSKWRMLRFYINRNDISEINFAIAFAEEASGYICQWCGEIIPPHSIHNCRYKGL